ncbi:hypothetical protein DH2020_028196 [Rehmannia glutinosa]|uniref:Exonuclease V n=1 Tax=Rehmannia glutinosa TaxID=99300 RepID=A0ABR0VS16_REHGL
MALFRAAFAAIRPAAFLSTQFRRNASPISLLPKRGLAGCTETGGQGLDPVVGPFEKKIGGPESFLHRFRRGSVFSVSDFTRAEWCEQQKWFDLRYSKHEQTKAMKAGTARHVELEEEVTTKDKFHIKSAEDVWALKFLKCIARANQLLCSGLTRELPITCRVEGVWITGTIDEIRMSLSRSNGYPTLLETKTRVQATLPGEPQRRNGKFQLSCYKCMWDILASGKFSSQEFFDYVKLDRNHILSPEIREITAKLGFPSQTLEDLVMYYENMCGLLPRSDDQLLLRYELQEDQSLLGEEKFVYDPDLLKGQIKSHLEFLLGEREARYVPPEERWKCRYCKYASICPAGSGFTMQKKE